MNPCEALHAAIERGIVMDTVRQQPGAVIQRCPADVRRALEHLTSNDALNLRPDLILPVRRKGR